MGAAEVASSAGPAARSPVAVNVVSELHHSLRFLLQKHHRVIVAALRWDFGGAGELDHAEQMLDAAITDFEALLEQIIDRRIANRASPTGTFYLGGRL